MPMKMVVSPKKVLIEGSWDQLLILILGCRLNGIKRKLLEGHHGFL